VAASINIADLSPEQRSELGIRKPRETAFSKDNVRS
jgi:hypothetical protein